jgi:hypothetical protein
MRGLSRNTQTGQTTSPPAEEGTVNADSSAEPILNQYCLWEGIPQQLCRMQRSRFRKESLSFPTRAYRRSLRDVTDTGFLTNSEKQDAVIRRIEIIGDSTAHLTETTRQVIPIKSSTRFPDVGGESRERVSRVSRKTGFRTLSDPRIVLNLCSRRFCPRWSAVHS